MNALKYDLDKACVSVHVVLMVPQYDVFMTEMATELALERRYYPAVFVVRIANAVVGIIEISLAVRIVLELFGASSSSQFVAWIYNVTAPLVGPFLGAFPGLAMGPGSVIDVVAILAMIGYAVLGWIIVRLLMFIFSSLTMP